MSTNLSKDPQINPLLGPNGQTGYFMKKYSINDKCGPEEWNNTLGRYKEDECVFESDGVRRTAAGGFGLGADIIKTRKEDKRLQAWGGCFKTLDTPVVKKNKYGETYNVNEVLVDGADTPDKCTQPNHRWDPNYLRKGVGKDAFNTKTMSDVLGEINNGRMSDIDIVSNVKHTRRGDVLMQKDNQETAVKGLVEETSLSTIFLSEVNTNIIQQTIRYKVNERVHIIVDYQSPEALYIVMRSIMLQHGNFRVMSKDLAEEIRKLNLSVVKYCVNEVSSNVLQYQGYIKDIEKLPNPMDRPHPTDADFKGRNRAYDMTRHIAPISTDGFQARHTIKR